jgi:hypothetical protein
MGPEAGFSRTADETVPEDLAAAWSQPSGPAGAVGQEARGGHDWTPQKVLPHFGRRRHYANRKLALESVGHRRFNPG